MSALVTIQPSVDNIDPQNMPSIRARKNNNNAGRECNLDGCKSRATFGFEGDSRPTYCKVHRTDGMVSHDTRHCSHPECGKRPNFGSRHTKVPTHCHCHKTDDMVVFDTRRCMHAGCTMRARFASAGKKPMYCLHHRPADAVNVTQQCCRHEGCTKYPCYGPEGGRRPTHCGQHRTDEMVNLKQKKCKTHMCPSYTYRSSYKGYCSRCFSYMFPESKQSKKYRTKEHEVALHLSEAFPDLAFVRDRTVAGGCSKYRPDLMCDLMTHVVIVEIDEYQHECYEQSCENKRLAALYQDFAYRPMVVIRFNPDQYTDAHGKRHASCFRYDAAKGVPYVSKKSDWSQRIQRLDECLTGFLTRVPDKAITEVRLFYDGQ